MLRLQEQNRKSTKKASPSLNIVPILIRGRVSTSSPTNTEQMLMGTGEIHPDVSAIKLLNRKRLKYKIIH